MKQKFDHILLSLLLGLSVLLGTSFWLNTKFGFNIFYAKHWNDLAQMQATHSPIDKTFYISIGVALFIFLVGLIMINFPHSRKKTVQKQTSPLPQTPIVLEQQNTTPIPNPGIPLARPPRLNLPTNMAEIAEKQYNAKQNPDVLQQNISTTASNQPNPYNSILSDIFSSNGYLVKTNPTIASLITNLFAIGHDEILWVGGVDCDINKLKDAITKLNSVFSDTLPDIQINVFSFLLDTANRYTQDDNILVFHSTDEIRQYISQIPDKNTDEEDAENFDAYSDYIDTIIQYIKNI